MSEMIKVLVFLSTYNGGKYLREQLDSIYAQSDIQVDVVASDDLSKDNTLEILEEYKTKYGLKYSVNKKNKNFTYNFLDLMFDNQNADYQYFAFADQDDFWLNDKLISAIKLLNEENKHFYCSNLLVVDENLDNQKPMNKFKADDKNHIPYILENICTGCTVVFDKEFLTLATKYRPNNIELHDYWLFLIANFVAGFVYDTTPHIYYRQHANNQIGSEKEGATSYYKNFKAGNQCRHQLLSELLNGYGNQISKKDKKWINYFLTYKKSFGAKMHFLFSLKVHTKKHSFLRRVKILFNKY